MSTPDKPQQMAFSDFNMQKLDTRSLEKHLACSIQAGTNTIIIGRRGSGKTEISKQKIHEAGLHEVYMNLSVFERVDLGGYPDMLSPQEKRERFVNYILPRMYEPMIYGDHKVVALLDEVDKADQSLWAPLLEFTQQRSINGRKLPQLQAAIMTGNLISEGGQRPSLPLLDRAEKYLIEPNAEAWLNWAGKSGEIHPSIYAFIGDNPNFLFDSDEVQDNYSSKSPRGWHLSSKVIKFGEEHNWDVDIINEKVAGYVGKEAGLKYFSYYKNYQVLLPMVKRIYNGEDVQSEYKALETGDQVQICMITSARLANQMDSNDPKKSRPQAISIVGKFMQNAGYENVLISVRSQIQLHRIVKWGLDEDPDWKDLLKKINNSVSP